jgi:hypothetical protein
MKLRNAQSWVQENYSRQPRGKEVQNREICNSPVLKQHSERYVLQLGNL